MRSRRTHSRGFTLLELIVAMMMVAMIAGALYSSLNSAFRAKRRAEAAIVPIRAAGVAMDILIRDLDSLILPNPETLNPESEVLYLAGPFQAIPQGGGGAEATWLSFYTIGTDSTPDLPLAEGIRRVEYAVANDGNETVLVRRIARNVLSGDLTIPAEEEEILSTGVRSFSLRFYDGIEWYDSWDSTTVVDIDGAPAVPMLVQIDLVLIIDGIGQPGEEANTYRLSRIVPISCAKAVDVDQTNALGTTTQ
jgi:general secretion pathway protein J